MKKRLVDADKLMERAKMNSVLFTVEHDHHDYGLTLGTLNKIVKECELSSAQPETHDKRTETHACDCISRQAAIDAIHEDADWLASQGSDCQVERMERDKSILRSLPSAQPGRKRGKWIPVTNGRGGHECSLCHSYAPSYKSGNEWLTDYCPNCGADMRGEQE